MAVGLSPVRARALSVRPRAASYSLDSLPTPPPAAPAPAAGAVRQEPAARPNAIANALGGGFSARNTQRDLLKSAVASGAYGPEYLRRKLLRRALLNRAAARRRAAAAAGLYSYGDPYAARSAAIGSEIGSSGDFSNELSNADLAAYGGYQDYARQLLGSERGYEDAAAQRAAEERANSMGTIGQIGGYLGGKVLDLGLSYLPKPKSRG